MDFKSVLTKDIKEGFEKYGGESGFQISHQFRNDLYKDREGNIVEHDVLTFSKDDKSYDLSIIEDNPLLEGFPDDCYWYYVLSLSKGCPKDDNFQRIHYEEIGGGGDRCWTDTGCNENDLKEIVNNFLSKMNE